LLVVHEIVSGVGAEMAGVLQAKFAAGPGAVTLKLAGLAGVFVMA
jgi:hypothetical protein